MQERKLSFPVLDGGTQRWHRRELLLMSNFFGGIRLWACWGFALSNSETSNPRNGAPSYAPKPHKMRNNDMSDVIVL